MSETIGDALVYAIAMGSDFMVYEKLPGKTKSYKELLVPYVFRHDHTLKQSAQPLAYFIASHFCDAKISVEDIDEKYGYWKVADGRTGSYLQFSGPTESAALRAAVDLAAEKVDPKLGAFDAALERFAQAERKQEAAALRERKAARTWPPAKGSKAEEALELAERGVDFFSHSVKRSLTSVNAMKASSKAAFIAKLKDKSLHLSRLDRKKGSSFDYDEGTESVEAVFCDFDDAKSKPKIAFEWVVLPTKAGDPEGQKPVAASKAKAKSR